MAAGLIRRFCSLLTVKNAAVTMPELDRSSGVGSDGNGTL